MQGQHCAQIFRCTMRQYFVWCLLLFNFFDSKTTGEHQLPNLLYFLESYYLCSANFEKLNFSNNNLLQRKTNTSKLFSKLIGYSFKFHHFTIKDKNAKFALYCCTGSQITAPRGNLLSGVCFFLPSRWGGMTSLAHLCY